jgi:hypothetical protein
MVYALSGFDFDYWLIYVAVTIVFEAVALGRWLGIRPIRALCLSLLANFITAGVGALFFAGFINAILDGVFGSWLNPNPFCQALLAFTVFGIGSAITESLIWHGTLGSTVSPPTWMQTLGKTITVHLAVIPVGLAVLLVPARPYRELEGSVGFRRWTVRRSLPGAIKDYAYAYGELPRARDFEDLVRQLQSGNPGSFAGMRFGRSLWAIGYEPCYSRFATGEERRGPKCEWNPAANGLRIDEKRPASLWLTRMHVPGTRLPFRRYDGVVVDDGAVRTSSDPSELGYGASGGRPWRRAQYDASEMDNIQSERKSGLLQVRPGLRCTSPGSPATPSGR